MFQFEVLSNTKNHRRDTLKGFYSKHIRSVNTIIYTVFIFHGSFYAVPLPVAALQVLGTLEELRLSVPLSDKLLILCLPLSLTSHLFTPDILQGRLNSLRHPKPLRNSTLINLIPKCMATGKCETCISNLSSPLKANIIISHDKWEQLATMVGGERGQGSDFRTLCILFLKMIMTTLVTLPPQILYTLRPFPLKRQAT